MRRVVVTGMGMVSPLGCGVETTWQRLIKGESGARKVDRFEVSDLPCKIACQIPRGDGTAGTYNADQWMEPKEQRKVDEFIVFAVCAATQALEDAGWKPSTDDEKNRSGVLIGSGIGGIEGIAETAVTLHERGPRRVSPFFIPGRIINLASGYVSIQHGLKGPNHSVVTACSTGAHAIGDAARLIALGDADVMVAGGAESPVNRISLAGFAAVRALSTGYNDEPTRASRPYDKDRDGFVLGEGSVVFVLEEYEHAKQRGARIYAEVRGYGATADAYHLSSLAPGAEGSARAMLAALQRGGLSATEVDYVSAHATSTPGGDGEEAAAIATVFAANKANLHVSGVKSMTGHLLGGAGAMGALAAVKAIHEGLIPPTINLADVDPVCAETGLNFTPHTAVKKNVRAALANSFGFGGTNASLVFAKV
ncbi:MAG: beta-ketoacyl-ACP synthase II [Pseudolabrys sp.]|nr:beta-ketoacyl-ACP synthase II [Pseudolabrys sp.]